MKTPEQTAVQWLQHVTQWLNKFDKSALSDPATLLLKKLETMRRKNELKAALDIIDDLKLLSEKCDTNERAEILLKCGLIAAEMGLFKEALMLSNEASGKYMKGHNYGIAQWMVGCIQWLLPGKEIDAISAWRNSVKAFETLSNANRSQKDTYTWYVERCEEMITALHLATKEYGIPQLPPYDKTSAQDSDDNAQENLSPENETTIDTDMDCLEIFPVYDHIKAGDFGPSGILLEPVGNLEIDQVFIDGRPHWIRNINDHKFAKVLSISTSIVIKVSGDSMNKADILNGDYILLSLLPKNVSDFDITGMLPEDEDFYTNAKHSQVVKDGDIVAAEILNEDSEVSLKRIYRRGNKIVLEPDSTNPLYQPREFDGMNEGFYVCGVVTAVLKPI